MGEFFVTKYCYTLVDPAFRVMVEEHFCMNQLTMLCYSHSSIFPHPPFRLFALITFDLSPYILHVFPFFTSVILPCVDFPRFGLMISAMVAYELLLERLMHAMKINKDNGYLLYSRSFMAVVKIWFYSHV